MDNQDKLNIITIIILVLETIIIFTNMVPIFISILCIIITIIAYAFTSKNIQKRQDNELMNFQNNSKQYEIEMPHQNIIIKKSTNFPLIVLLAIIIILLVIILTLNWDKWVAEYKFNKFANELKQMLINQK